MFGLKDISEEELRRSVRELWYWQHGVEPTNFTSMLFVLFQKADPGNRARLSFAFPAEAIAHKLWNESSDPEEFFKEWRVWPSSETKKSRPSATP